MNRLFPGGASCKESACQCSKHKRRRFDPWVRKILWSRKWQPTSVFLPGKFHGQRSLVGYSPWGCNELDMTERLSTQHTCHFMGFSGGSVVKNLHANVEDAGSNPVSGRSPGEENGTPPQYLSLENPMDRRAWWAIVHGVTKELDMTEQLSNNNMTFYIRDLSIHEFWYPRGREGVLEQIPSRYQGMTIISTICTPVH